MQPQDYLNTAQVAERYGVSRSWLTHLRSYGGGSPYVKVGSRVLYERVTFEKWLASHQRLTTKCKPMAA